LSDRLLHKTSNKNTQKLQLFLLYTGAKLEIRPYGKDTVFEVLMPS